MIDPAQIDYTDADYASLRRRLIATAQTEIAGWDDQAKHIGNLMIEAMSWAFDIASRYQDVNAAEAFMATLRRRENAEHFASMLGYKPVGRVPARYEVTVTLVVPSANDVEIPIGHRFYTLGSTARTFEAVGTGLIIAGELATDVTVEDTTGREDNQSSSNLPYQTLTTSGRPLPETVVVLADDGAYTVEPSLSFSAPTDKHATVDVNDDERVVVTFGDGEFGKVPVGTITVAYRVGGGIAGNVAAGAITQLDPLVDVLANSVASSCSNAEGPFVVGVERESVASIKQNAPAQVRVRVRTVTKEDYEIGAEQVSGVDRALLLTSNELAGAIPENHGYLYVVPTGLGVASQALLDTVLEQYVSVRPKTVTFTALAQTAPYKEIEIRAVVYFDGTISPSLVLDLLVASFEAYFAPLLSDGTRNNDVHFGAGYDVANPALPLNDLLCQVQTQPGVAKVGARSDDFTINGEHEDLTLAAFEWPKFVSLVIVNGATGLQVA